MDYEQFLSRMIGEVRMLVGDGITVSLEETIKNNGVRKKGLLIAKQGINISPTIYMEEYYKLYQGGTEIPRLAKKVFEVYEGIRFHDCVDGSCLRDYEKMKDRMVYKLVNFEKNRELLQNVPYIRYHDCAIVFYVMLRQGEEGAFTLTITSNLLHVWGKTKSEIYERARENAWKLLPASLQPMGEVIAEFLELPQEVKEREGGEMLYVLSNEQRNYGAACILYEGVLEMIGNRFGENYYILPSSVHEVILVPESRSPKKEELREIVSEVNGTAVETEEILSNSVYYFDRTRKTLVSF